MICHLLPHTALTRQLGYALQRRLVQEPTRAALIEPETDGWRTATPIANHPPHTGNQSRNPDQGHHFTHPGKPASSLPCCVVHAELSSPANPPADPMGKALGFLGHLDDIGLKIQNVSHDLSPPPMVFGVWVWVAHPPSLVVEGGWGASDSVRPR